MLRTVAFASLPFLDSYFPSNRFNAAARIISRFAASAVAPPLLLLLDVSLADSSA
jgi:hypothetical protein